MYRFNDFGPVSGGGAAALRPVFAPRALAASGSPHAFLRELRTGERSLVVDLGANIGSPEWLRGLATCLGLCIATYALAPGHDTAAPPAPEPYTDAQWEEARALSFAPLAYGGDTGRRMAASEAVEPLTETPERPRIDLTATLGRGDTLVDLLRRSGVSAAEAGMVSNMVGGAVPLSDLMPGTGLAITLGRRPSRNVPRPLESLAFRARLDLKLAVSRAGDSLTLQQIPVRVDETPLRIQGVVGSSLYRSARAAGVPARAIESFLRVIGSQIDVGGIGADDRFDIIVEHRQAETGEVEVGQLLYAGLDRARGKDLQLMQWTQDGKAQWFEASGVGKESGLLQRPVPGIVTSNFGARRHPILGYTRMHKGLDFRAGYGTPILAAADGRVNRAGWAGGYGRQVRIDHGGGLATSYSHMSRIAAAPGAYVQKGQVIGYVGSTGLSTGPHLHYEMYRNGMPVNPASVKFTSRAQLSGGELASFRSKLRNLLGIRVGAKAALKPAG
ncbi:MAG TPA: peptidoglycan DD-metalloendopeptidase family protein [Allosphingosinicella sp.]